jgi:hypothetical protein
VSDQDDDYITHAREWWREAKKEHPIATTIAEVLPVTGQIAAVADYADALEQGNTADGVQAALSFIPGIKMGKVATKLAPATARLAMTTGEKLLDPIVRKAPLINKATNAVQAVQTATATDKPQPAQSVSAASADQAMLQAYREAWHAHAD